MEPMSPALAGRFFNHWTTREVLTVILWTCLGSLLSGDWRLESCPILSEKPWVTAFSSRSLGASEHPLPNEVRLSVGSAAVKVWWNFFLWVNVVLMPEPWVITKAPDGRPGVVCPPPRCHHTLKGGGGYWWPEGWIRLSGRSRWPAWGVA